MRLKTFNSIRRNWIAVRPKIRFHLTRLEVEFFFFKKKELTDALPLQSKIKKKNERKKEIFKKWNEHKNERKRNVYRLKKKTDSMKAAP